MERKRLIRITKDKVYLTPDMCFDLSQTSLVGTYLSFRTVQDIYFEVEILDNDKATNKIILDIIDYQPKKIDSFKRQTLKTHVSFIQFKPLKWQQIERHLSSYTKGKLLKENIVVDAEPSAANYSENKSFSGISKKNAIQYTENSSINTYELKNPEPVIEKITEEANIYFKDADFNLGFVAFSYKSKKLNEIFNLKIENPFLLSEFNSVKSYFPKVFGGKKQFSIKIIFTLTNKVITGIITTSVEIESIDETIIDSIKRNRVANLTSTPLRISSDKSLFTAEDIFDNFDTNLNDGNVFKQSEENILNLLIEMRNIRNAKHLQYLSGSKHSTKQKLRFTLKPLFGFLFFIDGEFKNHFCWELLNSHATYLWSFDKKVTDIEFQFKRVEEILNIIRATGRETYKNNYKSNKVNDDLTFCTIEHRNINSAFKESFAEWQQRLEELLV